MKKAEPKLIQSDKARILLNCMPPAQILMPSVTLNILKSTLKQNGFCSELIYWNIKLESFFSSIADCFDEKNFEAPRLMPFVYHLSKQSNDRSSLKKIGDLLYNSGMTIDGKKKKTQPVSLIALGKTATDIASYISSEVDKFDFTNVILTGFTAKFYQWLPALFVAEETKKKHPEIETIIGGFNSKTSALEMLHNFKCFDFAVWGEGEYPLTNLSKTLCSGAEDFNDVAGLVYRKNGELFASEKKHRQYLDLDNYPQPDYDDFFSLAHENKAKGQFFCYPIESSRGCTWNQCKFCVLNRGYKHRERKAESISHEVESAIDRYGVGSFQFMDNNIISSDKNLFETILHKLSDFNLSCPDDFNLAAEIIPFDLTSSSYKKLAVAGFRILQIGGESFSDSLLKKMNKLNSFSDNILAYKFCLKYGINPIGANIITAIPGETDKDILNSIENIPFIRFFVGDRRITFSESQLALDKQSKFYSEMSPEEREKYIKHFLYNILPIKMRKGMNRFELFHFCKDKDPSQKKLWEKFFQNLKKYQKASLTYKIFLHGEAVLFEEFCNAIKTASLIFDRKEQWHILKVSNSRLVSFREMLSCFKKTFGNIRSQEIMDMMNELKTHHLLYFDENYNKIVSVIDTDRVL